MGKWSELLKLSLPFLSCTLVGQASMGADVPQSFTLDGQLFSDAAATQMLQDGAIDFKVQVLDEAKICVLYEETQSVSTLASKGYFTVQVGTEVGSVKRTSGDSNNSMATVFQNVTTISGRLLSNGSPCTVAPVAAKRRYVRITIAPATMGSTARVLSPDLTIDSVPNAVVAERAESLQGLRGADVLKVNTAAGSALSQSNLESLFTSTTRFNSLTAVIDGTSTNYMRSNSASGAQLPVLPGAPTTPPIGAIWFDSSDSKLKFQTSVGPATLGTGAGSVTSVGFTAPAELTVTGAPITDAGTIAVTWANQTTGKVFASPNGSTGAPTFRSLVAADAPFAIQNLGGTPSLQSGLNAAKGSATTAGRIWISTDTREIYRDNGTTWETIGSAASGATGAAGGDLSGTYPNPTVAKIQSAAVSVTPPTDGQVLKYIGGGTAAWTPTSFSVGDLKTSVGAQQFAGSSTCAASQTLTWSSLTDTFTCANIAGLDAAVITTGTISASRLPSSLSPWTVAGSDVYRATGNVGIGTTTPASALEVVGTLTVSQDGGGSMRIGYGNTTTANAAIAIGIGNSAGNNTNATAFGHSNNSGSGGVSFGRSNTTGQAGATAFGIGNTATAADSAAIGIGVSNTIANSLMVGPSDAAKMTILSTGDVGVGTVTPSVKLDVAGAIRAGSSATVTACGMGAANGEGSLRYNYTSHNMEYCDGTTWKTVNAAAPATQAVGCGASGTLSTSQVSNLVVAAGCTVYFKVWGAGGGRADYSTSGGGGFATITIAPLGSAQTYYLAVGSGGPSTPVRTGGPSAAGFEGGSGVVQGTSSYGGVGGGGASGVWTGGYGVTPIVIAGGGGGGGFNTYSTASAGCTSGTVATGTKGGDGLVDGAGGGGGGYPNGGAAGTAGSLNGRGGNCFVISGGTTMPGSGAVAGNPNDPDRPTKAGDAFVFGDSTTGPTGANGRDGAIYYSTY